MQSKIRMRRALAVVLVVGLLAFAIWATLLRTVRRVETETVIQGDIELSVTALGTVRPRGYVDVGAQASGAIRKINVEPGDNVKRGQLLVEIDPSLQQAKVAADRATLESLRSQLKEQKAERVLAGQQAARQRQLAKDHATRIEDIQSAEAALQVADARVDNLHALIEGAQSTLQGDEAQLGYTRIYSPMSGTVVTLDAREGQTLNATYQTPAVMRIADLTRMTVWTEVSEADIKRISKGMDVYFTTLSGQTDAGPRRWSGVVRQILPAPPNPPQKDGAESAQPSSNQRTGKVVLYTVLVDVDNSDDALMPEMTAQVFFVRAAAEHALLAPMTALQPIDAAQGRYRARLLVDGNIVDRDVSIGVHDRLNGQVLSGLAKDDTLVTSTSSEPVGGGRFKW